MDETLSAQTIELAYQLLLGRHPENEQVLRQAQANYRSVQALRSAFFESAEFREIVRAWDQRPALVNLDAPPIDVAWETTDEETASMMNHIQAVWEKLGRERPHWSVLSSDHFLPEQIERTAPDFFGSGRTDTHQLLSILRRHGRAPEDLPRLFEFGCGLGRVTTHFARAFSRVEACDISTSHMDVARARMESEGLANVSFTLSDTATFGMSAPFDVWYSRIVLQHNPPPVIAMILRRALRLLAPGGIAVFQVPTYALGYRFNIADYLARVGTIDTIEMHVLPQPVVFRLAGEAACEPLEVLEDLSAGPSAQWNSSTFVMQKAR